MSSYQQGVVTFGGNDIVEENETTKLLKDQGLSDTPDLTTIIEAEAGYDANIRHQVELLEYGRTRRSSFALVDIGNPEEHYLQDHSHLEDIVENWDEEASLQQGQQLKVGTKDDFLRLMRDYAGQIPAILVTVLLILMSAVPFGVAYFPIGWSNDPSMVQESGSTNDSEDDVHGKFPIPGKETLGIRMCLFATMVGQIVMTFGSGFSNPVSYQLLENVPFYHALARIVVAEQGYGEAALATLFFVFGLSSVLVGIVFYFLGRFNLGRVTYYFPAHVLVGCIGGIGVYIALTSIEVTNNKEFSFDLEGLKDIVANFHLYGLVVLFEVILRFLQWTTRDVTGHPRFRLLAPIFFCSIVPVFFLGLYAFGISVDEAREMGYMFPDRTSTCATGQQCPSVSFHDRVFDGHVLDIFRVLNLRLVDWNVVSNCMGVVLSLVSFSLIHVPINIPAFAVSSGISGELDMNRELMVHGYSNALSGIFGGLQNVMTYSFSVLFMKSGGKGVASSLSVALLTGVLFVYGPAVAMLFPRCMAGTLLLHIGLDLFLEGVWDSIEKFDRFEYCGIWLITLAMTLHGMTAALLAGLIVALSTFALQSITLLDPIFRVMSASTLRSSAWNRSAEAADLLDDKSRGRSRVLVVQLQGHLFFGNVNDVTDFLKKELRRREGTQEAPYVLLLDFSLVGGLDSTAAHAIAKLKDVLHRSYSIEVTIFVTGRRREGFPCAYALSEALTSENAGASIDFNDVQTTSPVPAKAPRGSISVTPGSKSMKASMTLRSFAKNHVFDSLDAALMLAEDILIAREKPKLLIKTGSLEFHGQGQLDLEDERHLAARYIQNLTPGGAHLENKQAINSLLSTATREERTKGEVLWKQGDESDCVKLLISGSLVATVDGTDVMEHVERGNVLGEYGLIENVRRLSSVKVTSDTAVLYSISRRDWEDTAQKNPAAARILDRIAIRYLAQRVQHVSNRIIETRCLPV